jgi:hypothetical protein
MRKRNMRLVYTGAGLAVFAVIFFFVMMSFASQSTDPKALLEIVGQTAGVGIGIGVAMAIIGFIGTKA